RRVSRGGPWSVNRAAAVKMADHRRAILAALGPVAAGHIEERRAGKRRAVGPRPGQHVVLVRLVGAAFHRAAPLVDLRILGDVRARRMQIVDAARDDNALGVLPRPRADAIARIDVVRVVERRCLRAEIAAPRPVAGARGLRKCLTVLIRAVEAAEVGALPRPDACYE